jgi:protein gp37
MASNTAIQWTDVTDNIVVAVDGNGKHHGWWCRKISPGCKFCYSEDINDSDYFGGNHLKYGGTPPPLKLREDIIDSWARQRKPKKHFVASMTDIFGEWMPQSWIFRFLDGMYAAPHQIFQMLTKRAANAQVMICAWLSARGLAELPPHMWIGFSVEDQERVDERISKLVQIPAAVRFLSVEPLLGPVELRRPCAPTFDIFPGIDWLIVGGESGPGARPCQVEWIRSIVEQCKAADVPVFCKQLGARCLTDSSGIGDEPHEWPRGSRIHVGRTMDESRWVQFRDRKGGSMEEWPADLRIREFPKEASNGK